MNATLQKITDEQDARLFRLIEEKRLLVNVLSDGSALITDGERKVRGDTLREAVEQFASQPATPE